MSMTKREQDALTQALANEELADKLLNEIQTMRDAFNAFLVKMDNDIGVSATDSKATLGLDNIRENGVNSKL